MNPLPEMSPWSTSDNAESHPQARSLAGVNSNSVALPATAIPYPLSFILYPYSLRLSLPNLLDTCLGLCYCKPVLTCALSLS